MPLVFRSKLPPRPDLMRMASASSYCGPAPRTKDGKLVRGVMKNGSNSVRDDDDDDDDGDDDDSFAHEDDVDDDDVLHGGRSVSDSKIMFTTAAPTKLGPTQSQGRSRSQSQSRRASSESSNHSTAPSPSPSPSPSPRPKLRRNISFGSIEIREHERAAGDNPCVSSGVPLGLGWKYNQLQSVKLDAYETAKGPSREKSEMMVPAEVRKQLLREEFDVSVKDMNAAMKMATVTKKQRRHTIASEQVAGWQTVLESAKRKFKRGVKGYSKEGEQAALWEEAHKSALAQYLKVNGEKSLGQNPQQYGAGQTGVGHEFIAASK